MKNKSINFCYAFNGIESKPLLDFIEIDGLDIEYCGVAVVPNTKNVYALFYDIESHICFSEKVEPSLRNKAIEEKKLKNKKIGFSFNGLKFDDLGNIITSKVPENMPVLTHFFYDKK